MRISRRSLLLGVGVPVACGLLAFAVVGYRRNLEPRFEGRTLSQWYWDFCLRVRLVNLSQPLEVAVEGQVAFRTFGDAAVPFLMKQWMHSGTNTAAILKVQGLSERLPSSLRPAFLVDERVRSRVAWTLLEACRPSWRAVRPYVEELTRSGDPANPDYRAALFMLGWIREGTEQAIPCLTNALQSPDRLSRTLSLQSLGSYGSNAAPALPALVAALEDPLQFRRAASVLARLGPVARPALPRLKAGLRETRPEWEREDAAFAIISIDPDDTEAADHLRQKLLSVPPKQAAQLVGWIAHRQLRPNPTIAALLDVAMSRPDLTEHRRSFIGYLPRHDPVAGREKVLRAFRTASSGEKFRLIGALLWSMNSDGELISWVCDRLDETANMPPYDRETCLRALSALLPGNERVTGLLEGIAARSPDETHRSLARSTLRRIHLNGLMRDLDHRDKSGADLPAAGAGSRPPSN